MVASLFSVVSLNMGKFKMATVKIEISINCHIFATNYHETINCNFIFSDLLHLKVTSFFPGVRDIG